MIICKICNKGQGNGYCGEHSTSGTAYQSQHKEEKECPKCHTTGGLFRCSFGALNCSNCMSYIPEPHPTKEKPEWEKEPEVQKWIEQGRTEEQVWAVRNFLTGQGAIMINRLLSQQRQEVKDEENKAWRNGERCDYCGGKKESNLIDMCEKCLEEA